MNKEMDSFTVFVHVDYNNTPRPPESTGELMKLFLGEESRCDGEHLKIRIIYAL